MLIKQKSLRHTRNLALAIFGELLIMFSFSIKVNMLYPLHLTDLRCCLLLLINSFLRTQILMTHIASYLYNILKLLRNHIMFMHLLMLQGIVHILCQHIFHNFYPPSLSPLFSTCQLDDPTCANVRFFINSPPHKLKNLKKMFSLNAQVTRSTCILHNFGTYKKDNK